MVLYPFAYPTKNNDNDYYNNRNNTYNVYNQGNDNNNRKH